MIGMMTTKDKNAKIEKDKTTRKRRANNEQNTENNRIKNNYADSELLEELNNQFNPSLNFDNYFEISDIPTNEENINFQELQKN